MKKSLFTLAVMLAAAALIVGFSGPAMAKVTGPCSNCHTMHNSQGGSPMAVGGTGAGLDAGGNWVGDPRATPIETLLIADCVGCHTSTSNQTIIEAGGSRIPIVYNTAVPEKPLAGGNFYWVADNTSGDKAIKDQRGHNVAGISSEKDTYLDYAPGGPESRCGGAGCHTDLVVAKEGYNTGCQGCHYFVFHHEDKGGYRFLNSHDYNLSTDSGAYVVGYEDPDWEQDASATSHNEYKGDTSGSLANTHAMSAYCGGCHGDFHNKQMKQGEWIRHPSDALLPDEDPDTEYEAYTMYNPLAPVARPDPMSVADPAVVSHGTGGDMVMCLSCHRPHGSPYPDLLRWDYTGGCDAGDTSECGCFVCHTQKGTYSNP